MLNTYNEKIYLAILCFTAICSTSATADESSPRDEVLATVNITAMRVESESSQLAITSIDADQYQQATHISEAVTSTPSAWISRGNGQENLTAIRSPVYVGAGACGAFIMSEDNISLRAANFCNVNQLFDANYIQAKGLEILRGPGTSAYGSNAIHGVINILSPSYLAEPHTQLSITDNSHGFNRYTASFQNQYSIAQIMHDDDAGYKDNSAYTQTKLRLKQLSDLSERWQLSQNFNYMNLDQDSAGYVEGNDAYKDEYRKKESSKPGFREAESYRYAASFNFQPHEGAELLLTPYLRSNDMSFSMHWIDPNLTESNGHDSIGIQSIFSRNYKQWKIHTGFDIDYTQAYLKQENAGVPIFGNKFPTGTHYDYDVNALNAGLFAYGEYQISEHWQYSLGARFDSLKFDYTNNLADGTACIPSVAASDCRVYRPSNSTDNFHNWSPRTSISLEFSPQQTSSINISRTFRSPQATELYRLEGEQKIADLDSVKADNIEWVFNGLIAGLNYNISAYYMKQKNVIIKSGDRVSMDGQKTRHQGVELALQGWLILDTLQLVTAYAYGKHQYDSNPYLLFASGNDIKGNIIDTAPRHLGSVKINWHIVTTSVLSLEAVYIDNYYLNPDNTSQYDGHTLTNASYTQELPWQLAFTASVKNLMDIDYADRADVVPNSTPIESRYFIGEPRSYQLTLVKSF